MPLLLGPDESNEPIAIDARERGEYSTESLRDDKCGDGGSRWVDTCDAVDGVLRGEVESRDVRWRFRGGSIDVVRGGACLEVVGGDDCPVDKSPPFSGDFDSGFAGRGMERGG